MRPYTEYRDIVLHGLYTYVAKPIFFKMQPETIHDIMVDVGALLGTTAFTRQATRLLFDYKNPKLEQTLLGMHFRNPIGLSAGFDKNVRLTSILPSVGFGFMEGGSVTALPCEGNLKPRFWRLIKSKSLLVYYGLNNEGADAIAARLKKKRHNPSFPLGLSVAMTNNKENLDIERAILDYVSAFRAMEPFGDYVTINISCPNAESACPFVLPDAFNALMIAIDAIPTKKPVFIKLSPDMNESEIDVLLSIADKHRIHGIICSNLTKIRDNPDIVEKEFPNVGGMSGKVAQKLADKQLAYLYRKTKGKYVLVGCGGVFNAEDAYRKIRLGASLIHMITGMVFEGPQVVSEINHGLAKLLTRDGFANISDAVGADLKKD